MTNAQILTDLTAFIPCAVKPVQVRRPKRPQGKADALARRYKAHGIILSPGERTPVPSSVMTEVGHTSRACCLG